MAQKKKRRTASKKQTKKKLSPAYAKRIARAMKKGKTRQQARGHKPKEHIARKQREIEEGGGITADQEQQIRNWYESFNPHGHKDIPTEEDLIEWVQQNSYARFQQYRKIWNAARSQYLSEIRRGAWESKGWNYLVGLTDLAGVRPEGDEKWLYYH